MLNGTISLELLFLISSAFNIKVLVENKTIVHYARRPLLWLGARVVPVRVYDPPPPAPQPRTSLYESSGTPRNYEIYIKTQSYESVLR